MVWGGQHRDFLRHGHLHFLSFCGGNAAVPCNTWEVSEHPQNQSDLLRKEGTNHTGQGQVQQTVSNPRKDSTTNHTQAHWVPHSPATPRPPSALIDIAILINHFFTSIFLLESSHWKENDKCPWHKVEIWKLKCVRSSNGRSAALAIKRNLSCLRLPAWGLLFFL